MATSSFSKGIKIEINEAADALLKAVEVSKNARPIKSVDVEASLERGNELSRRRYSR
jgi:hypothetical protein